MTFRVDALGRLGQHPDAGHVIAHISDTHLLGDDRRLYGSVDAIGHLTRLLHRLERITPAPQALVLTGDLADLGEPEAYRRLRALIDPVAERIGAEVVWVMGNHDERAPYSSILFGEESTGPQDRVHDVAGLRIVSLDTSVPGWHHGELTDDQLAWLGDELAEPAPHGTLLAMHHPPIPVPMLPLGALIELRDQHRLAAVLAGSDVRAILGGHFHFTSHSTFAGIPVSVAASSCYAIAPAPAPEQWLLTGVDADQTFMMVHVYADRVVHSVVPIADHPAVTGYGVEMAEPLAALSPQERFEVAARKDSPLYEDEHGS